VTPGAVQHVFVYGTLLPGDVRWHHLEPFVVDAGWSDSVPGRLYDTGQRYPAAIFDARAAPGGSIHGRTFALLEVSRTRCLEVLDEIEGVVGGRYRRLSVQTRRGTTAWAYEYGEGLDLVEIESGDWLDHLRRHS
jgi:gamma-glutamylcyclotransferase (GGCT)/AIG2-like uncharacterized protein YtfP